MRLLERVSYADLCQAIRVDEVAAATGPVVAELEPAASVPPRQVRDLAGLLPDYAAGARRPRGRACVVDTWWALPFSRPATYLAGLDDVTLFGGRPRQREGGFHTGGNTMVVQDRYLVPDSSLHRGGRDSLARDVLLEGPDGLGYDRPAEVAHLPGTFLLLGGASGHFGHFLLEGLSRLWALRHVPDLPVLAYDPSLAPFQQALLDLLDVPASRVVLVREPVHVDRLVVPSMAYDLHLAVSPEMGSVWGTISDRAGDAETPSRVYLSRARFPHNRRLQNEEQVEEVFARHGFAVVHPETLDVMEQVRLARGAEVLAGAAGSAMYLGAFQRPDARKLVLASRGFTFRDDELVSDVRRGRLAYYLVDDGIPTGGSPTPPRSTPFTVDVSDLDRRLGAYLAGG